AAEAAPPGRSFDVRRRQPPANRPEPCHDRAQAGLGLARSRAAGSASVAARRPIDAWTRAPRGRLGASPAGGVPIRGDGCLAFAPEPPEDHPPAPLSLSTFQPPAISGGLKGAQFRLLAHWVRAAHPPRKAQSGHGREMPIIGRDVLERCIFLYHGRKRRFVLRTDDRGWFFNRLWRVPPRLASLPAPPPGPREPPESQGRPPDFRGFAMHYPHKNSRRKRKRAIGFRARMKTTNGRKLINRRRRAGRLVNTADK